MKKRILITGGNGNIGTKLVSFWKNKYEMTIIDKTDPSTIMSDIVSTSKLNHSYLKLNLLTDITTEIDKIYALINNNDIIIHLAQINAHMDAQWKDAVQSMDLNNILFQQCTKCIIQNPNKKLKIIYASSNHVMGGYLKFFNDQTKLDIYPNTKVSPGLKFKFLNKNNNGYFCCDSTPYSSVKLTAERLLKNMCNSYPQNLECIVIRIGWNMPGKNMANMVSADRLSTNTSLSKELLPEYDINKIDKWFRNMWLSNNDLYQLYDKSVSYEFVKRPHHTVKFLIINGMSKNSKSIWRTANAIGYIPKSNVYSCKL